MFIIEEFVVFIPLKEQTTREDIFQFLIISLDKMETVDGVLQMIGSV